jgi:putative OPT family oligopeptide transporter
MPNPNSTETPLAPSNNNVAEVTARALILGAVLSVVMGAANTYLGLKVGMTVSASIPAAVVSMGILRGLFRRGTVLENNIVQTMASTGESLAAGAIFTIPALVMVGAWQEFRFWPTTLIVLLGGLLGIVFMVPIRRALIVERPDLAYPEGVACAEVLLAGERGGSGIRGILGGLGLGALFKFAISGFGLIHGSLEWAARRGSSVFYGGVDVSPALLAVGYIVNLRIASLVFLGGFIGWGVAVPFLTGADPGTAPVDAAWTAWSTQVRYIGVGAMLVGGLYSIFSVRKGIAASLRALRGMKSGAAAQSAESVPRTERDMPLAALATVFILTTVGALMLYDRLIGSFGLASLTVVIMVVAAFLMVAVATYIVGLVGSSNSPVSGMTICALLMTAGVLLAFGMRGDSAILATLGVAGVVCCAACTAGDVAQDLKTGLIVGATPARQQWTEILGALIPAFFFAPILTLLHKAYTIGSPELLAPQAALFASLTKGIFGGGDLPIDMIWIGAGLGVALILADLLLERSGARFRLHVMPVAVGLYLPFSLGVAILIGGLIRFLASRRNDADEAEGARSGLLFGSGLIAGEALMGIALAIPLVLGVEFLDLGSRWTTSLAEFALLIALYFAVARRRS